MRRGYPNPLGIGMRFNFSSSLGMGRVMSKYMRVRDGDDDDKTRLHPTPMSCLEGKEGLWEVRNIRKKLRKLSQFLKEFYLYSDFFFLWCPGLTPDIIYIIYYALFLQTELSLREFFLESD